MTASDTPLNSWPSFVSALPSFTEERCWELLALERAGRNRYGFLSRLYGRANKLRAARERREWLGEPNHDAAE